MMKRLRKCLNELAENQNEDDIEKGEKEAGEPEPENSDSVRNEKVCDSSSLLTATVLLDNLDVLECPTCYESLYTPVFQCKNGHISCNSCCVRLLNLCSFCRLSTGYMRCRAIENIIDSSRISCKNFKFGCPQILRCVERRDHESRCMHSPVHCPYECGLLFSVVDMGEHLSVKHQTPFNFLDYDVSFKVPILHTSMHHFLINKSQGGIFVIHNTPNRAIGNVVSITQCQPLSENGEFCCDVSVTNSANSSLKLSSSSVGLFNMFNPPTMSSCLIIPMGFFPTPNMNFTLYVRIYRKLSSS